ncbi:MAG: hypothetical protein LBP51_01160 [Deferribacteraceae bacterium]|jgi:hypothetical protein|nr:hypothetical protein [Deferribacteraceae bacterium]
MRSALLFLSLLFSSTFLISCTHTYNITTGVSADLKTFYSLYPSLEVDIAALTADEAIALRSAGIDAYFAPDSSFRASLSPYTIYFSDTSTAPVELSSGDKIWDVWLAKNPEKIAAVVNLPFSPDKHAPDPRIYIADMQSRFLLARKLYLLVAPKLIMPVTEKPVNPEPAGKSAPQTAP